MLVFHANSSKKQLLPFVQHFEPASQTITGLTAVITINRRPPMCAIGALFTVTSRVHCGVLMFVVNGVYLMDFCGLWVFLGLTSVPQRLLSLQALQESAHGFICVVNVCSVCLLFACSSLLAISLQSAV